jgi:hypothetical protein
MTFALCGLVLPAGIRAQDSDIARLLADFKADYESRLAALEEEVAHLRGSPPPGLPAHQERTDPPVLALRGFGNVDYGATDRRGRVSGAPLDTTNSFVLGDLDLFLTSQVANDISFLAETLLEFQEDGSTVVDVERLLIRYDAADWLALSVGRGHSAIGYWNRRFHHGPWLQTTADRPVIYRFEDEGGLLPLHFVGAQLEGTVELGDSGLSYAMVLGNGRGETFDEIQLVDDADSPKAITLTAVLNPRAEQDWGLGFSAHRGSIPEAPELSLDRRRRIDESILGGFMFYEVDPFEFLAEMQFLRHMDGTTGRTFHHSGGYVQIARAFDAWKPYYRYDYQRLESGDPYYADPATASPLLESTVEHTLGLRWDIRSYLALKAELRYSRSSSERARTALVQSSFAF